MKDAGILALGVAAIVLLSLLCVRTQAPRIEEELFGRCTETLLSNGIPAEGISFTGRDATLTGPIGSPIVSERARQLVSEVDGVRSVTVTHLVAGVSSGAAPAKPAQIAAGSAASNGDIGGLLNRDLVGFDDGSADLTQNGKKVLDSIGSVLARYPRLKFEIQGHTDSLGDPAWNQDLSLRRAGSVKAYLASRGVLAARLTTAGFGSARPVASNDTIQGRQRNRRIEFKVIGGR